MALYNYSYSALNTTELAQASDAKCVFCQSVIDNVRDARTRNQRIEGGVLTVQAAVASPGTPDRGLIVATRIDQGESRTVNTDGSVAAQGGRDVGIMMDIAVRWQNARWLFLDAHIDLPSPS